MAIPRTRAARRSVDHSASTFADPGLTPKEMRECRLVRDAEVFAPGIVRRSLEKMVAEGREPTQAALYEDLRVVVVLGRRRLLKPNGAAMLGSAA